jgi:hypothetical protein
LATDWPSGDGAARDMAGGAPGALRLTATLARGATAVDLAGEVAGELAGRAAVRAVRLGKGELRLT